MLAYPPPLIGTDPGLCLGTLGLLHTNIRTGENMLYLKTISREESIIAVSPIGESYVFHGFGSDTFNAMIENNEVERGKHCGVLAFDLDDETWYKPLSLNKDHYIIHDNGSTLQKI